MGMCPIAPYEYRPHTILPLTNVDPHAKAPERNTGTSTIVSYSLNTLHDRDEFGCCFLSQEFNCYLKILNLHVYFGISHFSPLPMRKLSSLERNLVISSNLFARYTCLIEQKLFILSRKFLTVSSAIIACKCQHANGAISWNRQTGLSEGCGLWGPLDAKEGFKMFPK